MSYIIIVISTLKIFIVKKLITPKNPHNNIAVTKVTQKIPSFTLLIFEI